MKERVPRQSPKRGFSPNFPDRRSRKSTRSWGPAFGEPRWPQDEERNRSFGRPFTNDLPDRDSQPEMSLEELMAVDRDDPTYGLRHLFDPVARAQHEAYMSGKPLTEVEGEREPEQQEVLQRKAESSEVEEGREEETSIQAKCDGEKQEEEAVNLKADASALAASEPESEEEISLKADTPAPKTSESESEEEINLKADTSPVEDSEEEVHLKAETPAPTASEQDSEEEVSLKADSPGSTTSEQDSEEEISLKADTPQVEDSKEEADLSQAGIQTQLKIGQPGDKYEKEADAKAAEVMKMEDPAASPEVEEESSNNAIQKQPLAETITPLVQRKKAIQRKSNKDTSNNAQIEKQLSQGGGQPLGQETRSFMESRFGADFSGVKVHTDSAAVQMNKDLGAQAFTHGQDIYYGKGKTPGKNELTAHELTHTIQQSGGKIQAKTLNNSTDKKDNKIQTLTNPEIQRREAPPSETSETAPAAPVPAPAAPAGQQPPPTTPAAPAPEGQQVAPPTPELAAAPAPGLAESPAETATAPTQVPAAASAAPSGGPSAPTSPQADPDFQAVTAQAQSIAEDKKQHDPAEAESKEAQDAAESPANEVESKAQDQQVGEMQQQEPGTFDGSSFKAALLERIDAILPTTEEEAENFKQNNKMGAVRQAVSTQVRDEQDSAVKPIEEKTQQSPDTSGIEPRQSSPMQPAPTSALPGSIGAEKATPKPKSEGEVSAPLQANSQSVEQQMAEAQITEEQLQKSNEPQFLGALEAKQQVQADAATAPGAYRQEEQNILSSAQTSAQTTASEKTQGMHQQQEQVLAQVTGLQGQTKGQDEQQRSEVADRINSIYQTTKSEVESALNGLESEVVSQFDSAANSAKQTFENYVEGKMSAYKQERYGEWYDVTGWDERISDAVTGLPPEVNQFFIDGKQQYINQMDIALTGISNLVAERLNTAKQKISEGKQQIQEYVASLPQNLQQVGQQAAQNIQSKFDQLEQSVTRKQDELINTLSQKYSENLQAVDTRIEEMKQQNQGLMDKFTNLMGGTIKTILEIKSMLEGALAGAAGAVGKIILDPVGFLGHLVTGLRQGFEGFVGNIGTHLQSGLVAWLTGTMGSMGIQIPEDVFSLPGIFSLATQVLGLTWDYIRGKATKMFGAQVVAGMEEGVEMVQVLRAEGPMGLWEQVQQDFGDLKEQVIDQIKEMVVTQVIQAGVVWILSLLNPASAFVKAAKAIYDIVMFFVNRGSQVMELVGAVTQAVNAIASGAVDGAAKLVEGALAKALPVVIGFLAALAGVGGLAQKVSKIVGRVRKRIDAAIEKVLKKARKLFKKKGKGNKDEQTKALGFEKGEVEVGEGHGDPEHDAQVSKGLKQIDREQAKYTKEDGKITQKNADKVAAKVKNDNPIFKSITVVDGNDTWDYEYVASRGRHIGPRKKRDPQKELAEAKKIFEGRGFKRQELADALNMPLPTAKDRIRDWIAAGELHTYQSEKAGKRDKNKKYYFDLSLVPEGPRPVRPNNRGTYGYIQPRHDSPTGIEIICKGLIIEKDSTSPTGYKYGYEPGKESKLDYLKTEARFRCKRTGKILQWGGQNLHLGHHPEGASEHWNRIGHTQTKAQNTTWNQDPTNYWGPEDAKTSQGTGGSTAGYNEPDPERSHPMWWDPEHPDYAGN